MADDLSDIFRAVGVPDDRAEDLVEQAKRRPMRRIPSPAYDGDPKTRHPKTYARVDALIEKLELGEGLLLELEPDEDRRIVESCIVAAAHAHGCRVRWLRHAGDITAGPNQILLRLLRLD